VNVQSAKVAITGASGGLGSALANAFASAGAQVVTMDLAGRGADVDLDVTDRPGTTAAFSSLDRLNIVIANAGVGVSGRVAELTDSDWDKVVDVNVKGTVNTVLAALPLLRRSAPGSLVIMASLSGLLAAPLLTPYSMTKHALVGLANSLRPELRREGIDVTLVCPGPVESPLLDEPSITRGISVRRYLTAAAGKPLPASSVATAVLDAVQRGRPMVTPGRAGLLWRLQRLAPGATAKQIAKNMDAELRLAERWTE
jgi:NAD(P)-dependent dehydrogenase (short-subunit alcohol dehydrogenase family)